MYMYHTFFIHSPVDGHTGFFHVLAILNSAVMNTGGHVSFSIMVTSEYVPSSGLLGHMLAQMVKNLPAMQETWVRSLGWEDPLEEGMATHFSILARRIPMDRGGWQTIVHGVAKVSDMTERLSTL